MKTDEKTITPLLGYNYVDKVVDDYLKLKKEDKEKWNETQMNLIVETMVNFIDSYMETFMKEGYPGDPVWIFEQLDNINNYTKEHRRKRGDRPAELKKVEDPLLDYRWLMHDCKNQPLWLSDPDFTGELTKPHQLAVGWFTELRLQHLHKDGYYFSPVLIKDAHDIIHKILMEGINRIKGTALYLAKAETGDLYHDFCANLPEAPTQTQPTPRKPLKKENSDSSTEASKSASSNKTRFKFTTSPAGQLSEEGSLGSSKVVFK